MTDQSDREKSMGWRRGPMFGKQTLKLRKRLKPADRYYRTSLVLDQGRSRLATAYAVWHWLVTQDRSFVGLTPEGLAKLAGWKRGQPAPTIEALMRMLETGGLISGADWMYGSALVQQALQTSGPVIAGLPWFAGMLRPDADGYIEPIGRRLGGHAVLVVGYDAERDAFRLLNSWGSAWGQLGRAWMRHVDFQRVLLTGQACVPQRLGARFHPERVAFLLARHR